MARMNWVILAVMLMIPGAAGLGWGALHRRGVAQQTAQARQAVADAPSADAYTRMYEEWSQLSAAQKAQTPWGHGRYGGPDIQRRLRQDQEARFEADLPELSAGLKTYPDQLAEVLYGRGWDKRLADFQRRRDRGNLVQTGSIILLSAGGLLCIGGIAKWLVLMTLRRKIAAAWDGEPTQPTEQTPRQQTLDPVNEAACAADFDRPDDDEAAQSKPAHAPGYFESVTTQPKRPVGSGRAAQVLPDSTAAQTAVSMIDPSPRQHERSYFGWAGESEEKESEAVSLLMTTHPVEHGLSELTEEVSAIRQYAAAQQDQMRKLQDGYDWMIIRRFCMRIIRCIDNLDDRIVRCEQDEQALSGALEDIRDELVFALESSGIEQYQPDPETPFKGLEKYAEAVRHRVPAPDPALAGAVAEIVRPGYQYLISDEDVKIVRCAQVKLYDAARTEA